MDKSRDSVQSLGVIQLIFAAVFIPYRLSVSLNSIYKPILQFVCNLMYFQLNYTRRYSVPTGCGAVQCDTTQQTH